MSGHSKWATTKRQKAVTDAKRAASFTRVANMITIAAREKGGDVATNFSLRLAIEKAKAVNMPKDNIDRAIKRGTGELEGARLEEITYEGFGPGGVALIIFTLTDNRNRTVADLKHILSKHGGNLGSAGSVLWMFEKIGTIGIAGALGDEQELALIEAGADDIRIDGDEVTIFTQPENLQNVKEVVEQFNKTIAFAEFSYRAKNEVSLAQSDQDALERLLSALDEMNDVTDYATNSGGGS